MEIWYAIVFRDHDGDWHGVSVQTTWDAAYKVFCAVTNTLAALDYYDDFPPTAVKIIDANSGAGSAYYAQAPALSEAVYR